MARYQTCKAIVINGHRKYRAGTFVSDGVGAQQGDVILTANQIASFAPGAMVPVGASGIPPTGVDSCD